MVCGGMVENGEGAVLFLEGHFACFSLFFFSRGYFLLISERDWEGEERRMDRIEEVLVSGRKRSVL